MNAPKRILDNSETRGLERRLLEAGSGIRLAPERKALLWQTIAAQLPPAPPDPQDPSPREGPAGHPTLAPEGIHALPTSPSLTPAGSAENHPAPPGSAKNHPDLPDTPLGPIPGLPAPLAASGAKLALGAVILALGGVGYLWASSPASVPAEMARHQEPALSAAPQKTAPPALSAIPPRSPTPESTRPQPPSEATAVALTTARRDPPSEGNPPTRLLAPEPATAESATPAAPVAPASADPFPAASAPPTPAEIAQQERANLMKEEAQLTIAARSALRSGNPGEALRLLEQARVKFGGGRLGQEREALIIEALGRSGQRDQARTRAEAFLKAFPSSPFAPDVRIFAPQ